MIPISPCRSSLGAPLNRYGLLTFLWALIFFNINGFSVFFSWWSMIGVSMSSVQRMIPVSPYRSTLEVGLALWRVCGCDDDGWFLVSEWNRENLLGCFPGFIRKPETILGGEKEGSFGDRGASLSECWDGECLDCEGWGGMICAGRWGCGFVLSWVWGCTWGCGWSWLPLQNSFC